MYTDNMKIFSKKRKKKSVTLIKTIIVYCKNIVVKFDKKMLLADN